MHFSPQLANRPTHHKLDFRNAFNSLRQDKTVLAVEELVPELLPLVLSAYGLPSSFFFSKVVIILECIALQGVHIAEV